MESILVRVEWQIAVPCQPITKDEPDGVLAGDITVGSKLGNGGFDFGREGQYVVQLIWLPNRLQVVIFGLFIWLIICCCWML